MEGAGRIKGKEMGKGDEKISGWMWGEDGSTVYKYKTNICFNIYIRSNSILGVIRLMME